MNKHNSANVYSRISLDPKEAHLLIENPGQIAQWLFSKISLSSFMEETVRSGFSLEKSLCEAKPVLTRTVLIPSCFPARTSHQESPTKNTSSCESLIFIRALVISRVR